MRRAIPSGGRINPQGTRVRNKETGEVFRSIRAAVYHETGGKDCRRWRVDFWHYLGHKYERWYPYMEEAEDGDDNKR